MFLNLIPNFILFQELPDLKNKCGMTFEIESLRRANKELTNQVKQLHLVLGSLKGVLVVHNFTFQ